MSKVRVLVADDQAIVRCGIMLLLQQQDDLEVVGEASDGSEAIANVQQLHPDVVLMDIEMPRVSGIDATRRITEAAPEVSVLILTVHDREDLLLQALQAGASGFLLKTANVDELLAAIRTAHAGDLFINPRMATKLVSNYLRRMQAGRGEGIYGRLSAREQEVLPLLAESSSNKEIASLLHLSPYTIQTYRQRIMRKLDLHSRTELLKYALRRGLVNL